MAFLNDITMQQLVTRLLAMAVLSVVIGVSLSGAARVMGDPGPWHQGRASLNPAAQLSWTGMAMAAVFGRGWGRPLRLSGRAGRLRVVAVVLLGLAMPLLILPLIDMAAPVVQAHLTRTQGYAVLSFLQALRAVTLGSILLNALPVPGLLAGNLWRAVWPAGERRITALEGPGLGLVTILLVLGWLPETGAILAALPF